jgi:hypothetical protein
MESDSSIDERVALITGATQDRFAIARSASRGQVVIMRATRRSWTEPWRSFSGGYRFRKYFDVVKSDKIREVRLWSEFGRIDIL